MFLKGFVLLVVMICDLGEGLGEGFFKLIHHVKYMIYIYLLLFG